MIGAGQEADLSYSDFEGAFIDGVNFSKTKLTGVKGLNQKNICKTKGYNTAILDFPVVCDSEVPSAPIAN